MGPTASGKTDLAIQLCQQLPCEIISVDSGMVYRGMDIGTAKPPKKILDKFPHHLIDIRNPDETYSAADFCRDAVKLIEQIIQQHKIPLLVGGTMMYFNSLQKGLSPLPGANKIVREKIGWEDLHARLQKVDPAAANRIHPSDLQRLQRALEIYEITGKSMTELSQHTENYLANYHVINIALAPNDRHLLRERIAKRFHHMLEQGLVEETKKLPPMRVVGYRQVQDYLAGKMRYEEMIEKAIIATQQLAKRQMTWLRAWKNLHWLDSEDPDCLNILLQLIRHD